MAKCNLCNKDFESDEALAAHNHDKHFGRAIQNDKPKSKKGLVIAIITAILILTIVGYFTMAKSSADNTINDDVQKVTLSMKGNYYPNTITVKEGVPVEITLDNSVKGCYRSFNIRALGVSQYSADSSQTITFTPAKKGTFQFACSMGMGRGTIIVE